MKDPIFEEDRRIRIACQGAAVLPWDKLEQFQGSLKKRTRSDIQKVVTAILEYGFSFPFFIWTDDGHYRCLDGHGRLEALAELKRRGYAIPELPVAFVEARDEEEAKQKLLRLNSQYGRMTKETVLAFTANMTVAFDQLSLPSGEMKLTEPKEVAFKTGPVSEKHYSVVVTCDSLEEQTEIFDKLTASGYRCEKVEGVRA